eukprot:990612-Amphidinium_carterae.1
MYEVTIVLKRAIKRNTHAGPRRSSNARDYPAFYTHRRTALVRKYAFCASLAFKPNTVCKSDT